MHNEHDQMSKRVAVELYDPYGTVVPEMEVPRLDAQAMDLWYSLKKEQLLDEPPPSYLLLPLRMAGVAAQLEFFSTIPGSDAVRDVIRKQLVWHHHLRLQARRDKQPMPPLFPAWITTPGKPAAYFERRGVRPAPGWPAGFYSTDVETELWFVVVSELSRTRDTVVLRLLGSEKSRSQAMAEIHLIPKDDPEWPKLSRFMDLLQHAIERDKTIPADERMHFMTEARAEQIRRDEETERRGERRGLHEGERKGLREAVYDLCEVLKVSITAPRRQQVEQMSLDELRTLRHHLKQRQSWPKES